MLKQRLCYLVLLLAAAAFHIFFWDYIAFAALLLVLAMPVLGFLCALITRCMLRVRLEEPLPVVAKGQPSVLRVTLENRFVLPVPAAKLRFTLQNRFSGRIMRESVILPLPGSNTVTVELDTLSDHCGLVTVTLERLSVCDFFAVTAVPLRCGLRAQIAVLPEEFEILAPPEARAAEGDESQVYSTRKPGGDASQVFDYHEYREGDKLKDIHWKLSTKLDRLMVKEHSLPIASAVRIAVEFAGEEASLTQLDLALEACVSLSAWLLARECMHEVEWFSTENSTVGRQTLERQDELFTALHELYRVERYAQPFLLEEICARAGRPGFTSLLYITLGMTERAAELLTALRQVADIHVVWAAGGGETPPALLQSLEEEGISVTVLRPDTVEEELSRFEL